MTKGYKYKVEDCITAYKNAYQKDLNRIIDFKLKLFDIAKSKFIFKALFWISDKDLFERIDSLARKTIDEWSIFDTLLFGYENCLILFYYKTEDLESKLEIDLKRFELIKNRYVWLDKNEAEFIAKYISKD